MTQQEEMIADEAEEIFLEDGGLIDDPRAFIRVYAATPCALERVSKDLIERIKDVHAPAALREAENKVLHPQKDPDGDWYWEHA